MKGNEQEAKASRQDVQTQERSCDCSGSPHPLIPSSLSGSRQGRVFLLPLLCSPSRSLSSLVDHRPLLALFSSPSSLDRLLPRLLSRPGPVVFLPSPSRRPQPAPGRVLASPPSPRRLPSPKDAREQHPPASSLLSPLSSLVSLPIPTPSHLPPWPIACLVAISPTPRATPPQRRRRVATTPGAALPSLNTRTARQPMTPVARLRPPRDLLLGRTQPSMSRGLTRLPKEGASSAVRASSSARRFRARSLRPLARTASSPSTRFTTTTARQRRRRAPTSVARRASSGLRGSVTTRPLGTSTTGSTPLRWRSQGESPSRSLALSLSSLLSFSLFSAASRWGWCAHDGELVTSRRRGGASTEKPCRRG